MRYKLMGRSGLRVSELCLGTMTFGEDWGWGAPLEECRRMLLSFTERGGNFLDTANNYTNGSSERIVGELINGKRDRYVVATKYTLSTEPRDPNAGGNHRKNMMRSVEASLKRLRTDYIDLLWVHAWDGLTPEEEVMRGLDDLVRMGKVLYVGVSDTPAWMVARSHTMAELRSWTPFVGLQIEYSLIQRTVERELLPMARALGLTVTPWGVVGGGVLTGKYSKGGAATDSKRAHINAARVTDKNLEIAAEVQRVANDLGRFPSQVALAWLRQKGSDIIPIVGARTASQLDDNLDALDLQLTAQQMSRLDAASAIDLGFPHDFLELPFIRSLVHGETWELIDRRR
ncbi:MAG: aldo/keto reductase [Deltaproteobacteria bacterium]|nr:aldo/keto reductase [Deltaproteobacteria bacterium]